MKNIKLTENNTYNENYEGHFFFKVQSVAELNHSENEVKLCTVS